MYQTSNSGHHSYESMKYILYGAKKVNAVNVLELVPVQPKALRYNSRKLKYNK